MEKRLYALDILKFAGSLMIVFHHCQQFMPYEHTAVNTFGGGITGGI